MVIPVLSPWWGFKKCFLQETHKKLHYSFQKRMLLDHDIPFSQVDSCITDEEIIDLMVEASRKTDGMVPLSSDKLFTIVQNDKKPLRDYFLEEFMSFVLENRFNAFRPVITCE